MTQSVDLFAAPHVTNDACLRSERRESLRLIDYAPFPRMDLARGRRVGLSLNESDTGLLVATEDRVEPGELLRIVIRGVDGGAVRDIVARVVWCEQADDDSYRMGLAFLRNAGARMLRARHRAARRDVVVMA